MAADPGYERGDPDAAVARIASRSHGLVTVADLRRAGLSTKAIQYRVNTGRLQRLRRGIYAAPAVPPSFKQAVLAAVLACGETAAASHATAAQLWNLPVPPEGAIEITTVLERHPRRPGVRLHQSGLLVDADVTTLDRIPLHRPERVAVELSSRLTDVELGLLVDDALRRCITSLSRLWCCHERLPLAPGRSPKRIERVLRDRTEDGTESELEKRVLGVLSEAGVRLPLAQHRLVLAGRRRRIDLAYPDARVALECDSFEWHRARGKFDDDRARANELVATGWRVLHFTSAMTDAQIANTVRRVLEARRA